ncbi:hypothetical protein L1987_54165 [Smallanthus sonchifolius]|uniref:Uncharacterized protein n=1 Tax=Smallanthus sonchifolius TaxID=185202 RepID=A0ACB9E6D6_9ASTR|nr:hypothetical protein L1987_54165 [Smallanthus sonchifolius]
MVDWWTWSTVTADSPYHVVMVRIRVEMHIVKNLKDLAEQLGDVDQLIFESRLVRGLPREFSVVGTIINQSALSWDTTFGMLQLEQLRQNIEQPEWKPTELQLRNSVRVLGKSG